MSPAFTEARRRGSHFGLLFRVPQLERYYAQFGWQQLDVAAWLFFTVQYLRIPKAERGVSEAEQDLFKAVSYRAFARYLIWSIFLISMSVVLQSYLLG